MQSKINFVPYGNRVLIRADFEVSSLNLLNDEIINKTPAKTCEVVGVGNLVKDITIGQKVFLAKDCRPTLINFDWNNQSLKTKRDIHKSGKSIIGATTISFCEYLIVEPIDILGIWIDKETTC